MRFAWAVAALAALLATMTPYLVDWGRPALPKPEQAARSSAPAAPPYPSAEPAPSWVAFLRTADGERGKGIMQSGLIRKDVQACTSCHGVNGQPVQGSNVPRLSGQSAYYLAKQLADYASGTRKNPMMSRYAQVLTDQQRADVAVAWSGRSAPYEALADGDPAALSRGRDLFERGDDGLRIQACSNCHWLGRLDARTTIPYVAGQHRDYTINAFKDWGSGARRNDGGGVMRSIVAAMGPDDRIAVAAYLATVQPPPGAQ